jgi:hypothetical protein
MEAYLKLLQGLAETTDPRDCGSNILAKMPNDARSHC